MRLGSLLTTHRRSDERMTGPIRVAGTLLLVACVSTVTVGCGGSGKPSTPAKSAFDAVVREQRTAHERTGRYLPLDTLVSRKGSLVSAVRDNTVLVTSSDFRVRVLITVSGSGGRHAALLERGEQVADASSDAG